MMLKKLAVILAGSALLSLPALGDDWNKKTTLTFSHPVEIPGVVLPAGTYVFKLADSLANRNIVQVFNSDENMVYATILAIPHYRMSPADKTVILFEERPADRPQAIHAWFYPGETYGQEFVYPKRRALELAQATHQPVLTADVTPAESLGELENAPVTIMTPENREVEIIAFPPPTTTRAPAPALTTSDPEPAAIPAAELPETASPLPGIALLGICSIAAAWLLRTPRSRRG